MRKLFIITMTSLFLQQGYAQQAVWAENFNGTLPPTGWSVSPSGAWQSNTTYFLPPQSQSIHGLVPNQMGDSTVLTTSLYPLNYGYIYLRFSHICKVSPTDRVRIEYRIQQGQGFGAWTVLPALSYVGIAANYATTGFNASSYPEWQANDNNVFPTNAWWKEELFDLGWDLSYETVQFRFVINHGMQAGTQIAYGWLLENFEVIGSNSPIADVSGINLNKKKILLDENDSTSIKVSVLPLNAANKNIGIVNTNPSVAYMVDSMIYALSAGTTQFIFTTADGGFKDTCTVTVKGAVNGTDLMLLQINPLDKENYLWGNSISLNVDVKNNGNVTINNATLGWSINGVVHSYMFSTSLAASGQQNIVIDNISTFSISADSIHIVVWVETVNGVADTITWNNTLSATYYRCFLAEFVAPLSDTLINKPSFEVHAKIYVGTGAPTTTPQLSVITKTNGMILTDNIPMLFNGSTWVAQIPKQFYNSTVIYSLSVSDLIMNSITLTDSVYLGLNVKEPFDPYLGNNLALIDILSPVNNPSNPCPLSAAPLKVVLANLGTNNHDFSQNAITINYTITDPMQVVLTGSITKNIGTLLSEKADTVELLSFLPLIANGAYTIKAWVSSPIDYFSFDDTVKYTYLKEKIILPYDEEFNNVNLPNTLISTPLVGTDSWKVIQPSWSSLVQPNSGTRLLCFDGAMGNMSQFTTQAIDLFGIINPVFEFWYYHDGVDMNNSYTEVSVFADGTRYAEATVYKKGYYAGWARYTIQLNPYMAAQCVYLQFESMNKTNGQAQYIDRILVSGEHDLAVSEIIISPEISDCGLRNKNIYVVVRATSNQGINYSTYPTALALNISGYSTIYHALTGSIAGNTSDTILVAQNINFTNGAYSIQASLSPRIDNNPFNDMASMSIAAYPSLSVATLSLTGGNNCLIVNTTATQGVKIKNTGNMALSEVIIKLEVLNSSQTLQTVYDTLVNLPSGDSTIRYVSYDVPSEAFYSVDITSFLACDSVLANDKLSLMECADFIECSIISINQPIGIADQIGNSKNIEVSLKNESWNMDYAGMPITAHIENMSGGLIYSLKDTIGSFPPNSTLVFMFKNKYIVPNEMEYIIRTFIDSWDLYPDNDTAFIIRQTCVGATTQLNETICEGNTFDFHGKLLTIADVYYDTLQSVFGCDSIVELTLNVNPVYLTPLTETICEGNTFDFNGKLLTIADVYYDTLQSIFGCDSIVELTLNVNVYLTPISETICEGDTINFNGKLLTTANVYYDTLTSIFGCDSLICLTLTIDTVSPVLGLNIAKTGNSFTITWQANAASYLLYRNGDSLTTVNTTTYTDNNLTNGTTYCYKIKAINGNCESDFSAEVCETFNNVGIVGANGICQEICVYPNPTNGKLQVTGYELQEHTLIEIYDIFGRKLNNYQLSIVNSQLKIDVLHLAQGMYFLKIDGKTVKFVKE